VQELGIPIVVTDADGIPAYTSNLPFEPTRTSRTTSPAWRSTSGGWSGERAAGGARGLGTIYFGDPPLVRAPPLDPLAPGRRAHLLLAAAAFMVRHNQRVERERIWATMARESAHQMGTPLSSLAGWVEILRLPAEEREEMASLPGVAAEMEADLDRLEKVAHRFEWIGRPVRQEAVDVRGLLRTLERYVRVRMPQLARATSSSRWTWWIRSLAVLGNAVLLEWAFENLVKNALDALAGTGGTIEIRAERESQRRIAI
jgi:signal transduction histidine kinase